jgi:hypothetical protein
MTRKREQGGFAGRNSAAGRALAEFMRISVFFVLVASIAAVLAAGAAEPDEPYFFENAPLCLHGS